MIRIGCCGLPLGLKNYSKEFKVVELNSTFYKLPKKETALKWRSYVEKDFVFCLKAFQAITHDTSSPTWKKSGLKDIEIKKLAGKVGSLKTTKEVLEFWRKNLEICKVLDAKVCLIQLPKSFRDSEENLSNSEKFFERIERNDVKIAIELRGWREENIKKICRKFDLIDCCDPFFRLPVYFGKEKIAYLRLHGKDKMYNYDYTKKDLLMLKKIVEDLKVNDVFVFFNNIFMLKNAREFSRIVD